MSQSQTLTLTGARPKGEQKKAVVQMVKTALSESVGTTVVVSGNTVNSARDSINAYGNVCAKLQQNNSNLNHQQLKTVFGAAKTMINQGFDAVEQQTLNHTDRNGEKRRLMMAKTKALEAAKAPPVA